jgi:hypothetical protein
VHADRAARLERQRVQAVVVQLDLDDVRRLAECRGGGRGVSVAGLGCDITGCSRPDLRRARFDGRARIDYRRQVLVLDADQLGWPT